ncbi:uncharacterized protein LOC119657636 [Hermetia illucens]|nr:uncharacterized protein LOC119657636 [Hermetia illucens]
MSINRNNFDVSDFINVDFFHKALTNGLECGDIEIKEVVFTGGTKPGQNYCSQIHRATVTFRKDDQKAETIHLIVKYLPTSQSEFFKQLKIFDRENEMYTLVLNKMKNILKGEDIAPRYFYYTDDPTETIIFEDVTPLGYKIGDDPTGLDEKHCELVFTKLARYHAASMVLAVKHPEILEKFKDSVKLPEKGPDEPNFFLDNFKYLAQLVASWPGFEETAKKLDRFIPTIDANYNDWSGPAKNEIKVLTHCDLWTNNILFKYDGDAVKDVLFIDFQISYFSSPGIDLMHFLYTSPQFDILNERRDHMVEEYYYKTLASTLEDLGYLPIPTFADIVKEMEKREVVGFMWSMIQLFVICIDKDDCVDKGFDALNDAETGLKLRNAGMTSERFTKTIKYILRRLERVGVLQ